MAIPPGLNNPGYSNLVPGLPELLLLAGAYQGINTIKDVGLPRFSGSPSVSNNGIPGIGDMDSGALIEYFKKIGYQVPGMLENADNRSINYQTSGPDVNAGLRPDGSYGPANQAYGMSADELNNLLVQALQNGGDMSQGFKYFNPSTNQEAFMPGFNPNPQPIVTPLTQAEFSNTFYGDIPGFGGPYESGPVQDNPGAYQEYLGTVVKDWYDFKNGVSPTSNALMANGNDLSQNFNSMYGSPTPEPDQNIPQFDTSMFEQTSFNLPSTLSSGSNTTQASGGYTPMSSGQTDTNTLGSEDFMNILNSKKQAFSQPSASIV